MDNLSKDILNIIYHYIDYNSDELYTIFKNNKHKRLINKEFDILDLILLCIFHGYIGFKINLNIYNANWRIFINRTKYNNIISEVWSAYDITFKLNTIHEYKNEDIIDFYYLLLLK